MVKLNIFHKGCGTHGSPVFERKLKGQRQGNRQGTGWAKRTVGKATEAIGKTIGRNNYGNGNTEIIR